MYAAADIATAVRRRKRVAGAAITREMRSKKEGHFMHDKNGKPLKMGDKVIIEGEITSMSATDDFCNVTVSYGVGKPHAPDNVTGSIALNAKQVEKIDG